VRAGLVPAAIAKLERNPKRMVQVNAAMDAVLAVLDGATEDVESDPNGRWPGRHGQGAPQDRRRRPTLKPTYKPLLKGP
jgi:hypothetical protein